MSGLALSGCGVEGDVPEPPAAAGLLSGPMLATTTVNSHGIHSAAGSTCSNCHSAHGGMMGSALIGFSAAMAIPGQPAPTFNTSTKTCSNVTCHTTPAGTFTYAFPGGDGEPVAVTVAYGGLGLTTPPWNAAVSDCGTCHGNPPQDGTVWHSGHHAGAGPTAAANQCQFCHRDAVSTAGVATGLSTATTCGPTGTTPCASLHRNGAIDVQAAFKSSCFGCH